MKISQAFSTERHPLGTLMQRLEIVYKASYGGMGANKYLLPHAIAETHSLIQRIHSIVRYSIYYTPPTPSAEQCLLSVAMLFLLMRWYCFCSQDLVPHVVWWGSECLANWTDEG